MSATRLALSCQWSSRTGPVRSGATLVVPTGQPVRDRIAGSRPGTGQRNPSQALLFLVALIVVIGLVAGLAVVGQASARKRAYITTSWLAYETYIPMAYVDAPEGYPLTCEGGADWWYSGDGRGPGFNTGRYRIRVAIDPYNYGR